MAVAVEILQKSRPGWILRIAFGFFLGAAVLAKGPAAVILAGGATVLWAVFSGQWRAPFRFLHPVIIAAFCATALPWYVFCALRNADFLRVFIWQHNFERYLTPIFEHRQPFWYYGIILLLAVMPWMTVFAIAGVEDWRLGRSKDWKSSPGLFFACWGLFPVLFFSLSQSKLPGYILPAIPPLFALMAHALGDLLDADGHGINQMLGLGGAGALLAGIAALTASDAISVGRFLGVGFSAVVCFQALMGAGGIIAFGLSITRRAKSALILITLLVIALVGYANLSLLPAADGRISARAAAHHAFGLDPAAQNIAVYGLKRDWQYGLNYYFNRELPQWMPGAPWPEWLFTTEENADEFERPGNNIQEVSRAGAPFVVLLHVPPELRSVPYRER